MGAPVVAIVGRPNVGKSTLLNRIIGRRAAIVEERPGVTRDRKEVEAEWQGRRFRLVDTGGWMAGGTDLDDKVSAQAERAMAEADVVLLVVDVTTGATEDDARVAELLRRTGRQALVVANKVDDTGREADMWELLSLGLGEPHPVSAPTGGAPATCSTRSSPCCPRRRRRVRTGTRPATRPTTRSRWPSSGVRTWASRRCSTA